MRVLRSLITLKALTYGPTGGIVAAPTTSLPEQLGGMRNWDYRFCWLRDATLTLLALMNAGFYDEAQAWREWLLRAVAGSPDQVQIMYGIAGERRLTEWEVPWLPGYEGSAPVRIGNAAHSQLQLDVFGEVMDALHQARCKGLAASESGWALQQAFLVAPRAHLDRAGRRHLGSARRRASTSPIPRSWPGSPSIARSRARSNSASTGRSIAGASSPPQFTPTSAGAASTAELGSFVQSYGAKQLDASLLLLPLVGFLPPDDPRVRGTLQAIEQRLMVDGFVMRYDTAASRRRLAARRGRVSGLQLLAGRRLYPAGRWQDARRAVRAAARPAQRRRIAERGIRPAHGPAGRQFSAGVHPRRPGQQRVQPDAIGERPRNSAPSRPRKASRRSAAAGA